MMRGNSFFHLLAVCSLPVIIEMNDSYDDVDDLFDDMDYFCYGAR
jgi:hypothetical protein